MANEVQTATTSAENTATSSVKMFSEFLRYAASGFVLLIGIWAGVPTSIKDIKESMGMEHWPFLVLGPVLGLILYAVHRNTVAPLMYWLVLRKLSDVALLQAERWKKRHRGDPNTWALVREIDNWSAWTIFTRPLGPCSRPVYSYKCMGSRLLPQRLGPSY